MFDKAKFIDQYKAETREHIQKLNQGLLRLEKNSADKELLESMMREAHTIKGSSTMMGYKRIADIAHKMEDGLQNALEGKLKLNKQHFDVLFKGLDAIEPLLEDKVTWEDKGIAHPFADELCERLEETLSGKPSKSKKIKNENITESLNIESKEHVEEAAHLVKPSLSPVSTSAVQTAGVTEESIRVDIEKLDNLMNLSGELLISKLRLNELVNNLALKVESQVGLEDSLRSIVKDLKIVDENIDLTTSTVEDEVMKLRMVSISYLFSSFPRAMRDLAFERGKEVNLEIKGEDTQLDKAIIDELKDPLMHILRNAVDHGIETNQERKVKNKPQAGKIILNAYQQGSQVVIEISDDGKGIDAVKVKEEAVKKNIISQEKASEMVYEQVFQLLFIPGFTTAEKVTEVSGRGVGLDVVREKIAKLKGVIEVKSVPGFGAKFILKLPLTLAITECLLITSGVDTFAIPIDTVVETIRINSDEISTVETKEAITVRGHIMPLVRLNDIFGLPSKGIIEKKFFPLVIVQAVEKRIGILVDQLIGRQDIVRKSLKDPLKNVRNISGATILGDGRVILILDIPSIIESAEGVVIRRSAAQPRVVSEKKKHKTILLAEDALSTAMLEKNILESSGFSVVIARDGKEALERASQEKFDLVITDVLMPRMDGFELTQKLKQDKLYKEIPVIIVTTRESDADKRRGLEVGADAYILKSEFTSEGLLETIERLIG